MNVQMENLLREAKIRKGIILYGNTRDEFFDQKEAKYSLLPQYLRSILKDNGFEVVGLWNNITGLQFSERSERRTFAQWLEVNPDQEEEVEEYDLGSDEDLNEAEVSSYKDFDELIAALTPVMEINDRPAAFILDWTDFHFGTVQTPLSPEDRSSLQRLGMLLTGDHGLGKPSTVVNKVPCVVIIITSTLSSIPPVLYQPEPRIKLFNLGLPDRKDRIRFLESHMEDMCLKSDPEKSRSRTIDDLADLTDGLKIIDMVQITKLGHDNTDLTAEKLINLYRFGQRRSPWEDLSDGKLMTVEDELRKRVVGQDHAVEHVSTTIIKAAMGLSGIQHSAKMSKPKGVLFFVGPTGVGKTELAKATAEFLFGDETACIRFDMSEYSHEESDQRLIGAPPGYVGFEDGGQLINAVLEKPFSVLLFDEIEKAHPRILDKFLQIFEDGRLTDGKGVTAYFSESIIIFTSNIGASSVDSSKGYDGMISGYMREVKDHFNNVLKRPELLNRIGDNIIVFNTIEDRNLRQEIIKRKLKPLQEIVRTKFDVELLLDNEIYTYFEKRAEMSHGGRGLLNAAERDLINPLSRYLFRNKQFLMPGRSIHVSYDSNSETKIKFDITE